jgi:hypothetical protein
LVDDRRARRWSNADGAVQRPGLAFVRRTTVPGSADFMQRDNRVASGLLGPYNINGSTRISRIDAETIGSSFPIFFF